MIQSIYASVSNADVVPCGKKGKPVSSEPVYLLKNKYLGEYRTELEKAKVRKNLGIADNVVLEWGNITGFIEDNADLKEAFSYKLPEHLKDIIKEDFTTVKGALNWAIEYISTFVTDTESIAWLREQVGNIQININQIEESLDQDKNNIQSLQESVEEINRAISKLDEDLSSINVNESILTWIKNASSNSIQLTDNSKLEVKIADLENNALQVDEQGLFVQDLSEDVSTAKGDIENLQSNVQTLLDNYVSKEDLGGNNFNFVNQEEYDEHVQQANDKFSEIDAELNRTVKTGEDGHVDTLYVNKLSNQDGNIKIDKSLEVQSGVPLDIRTVVKSVEDLYNLSPKTSYAGMAVANIGDGNIYMLIDPTRITEKGGWKASYESLQIVTCTQEDYDAMAANTKDDYTPEQEGLPFLYRDTYYYIYEEEKNSQYYVTAKQIEDWLKAKASAAEVETLKSAVKDNSDKNSALEDQITSIINDYSTTEQVAETYATKKELLSTDQKFDDYYTQKHIDETFVTKESLRGDLEGEDDFVFVTQNQYNTDKETKAEADAISITTQSLIIKKEEVENTVTVVDEDLSVNNKPLAYREEVPKIQLVETKAEYEEMEKDPDTYYYVCDDETVGYLTNMSASDQFFTKVQVNTLIAQAKQDLIDNYIVPLQLEIAALKGQTL